MAKFPEADARLFFDRFVCRKCKSVQRAPARKIADRDVKCRSCSSRDFKPKRKK